MAAKIGLIAEDLSDIEVIKKLAKKLTGKSIVASHFVGKGCGSIKRKTPGWCKNFLLKGCTRVLLVHDLDRNKIDNLRSTLEQILGASSTLKQAVIIPVEELEAWLLSDMTAIASAMNLPKTPKAIHHPENVASPKEYIRDSVWQSSNKKIQYVNSVHNGIIANHIDVTIIQKKCPSFKPFADFFNPPAKKRMTLPEL